MHSSIKELFNYIKSDEAPKHNKEKFTKSLCDKFGLVRDKTIFYSDFFAVRVSFSKTGNFSNTVLSLSALQKYDAIPIFVVLISSKEEIEPKILMINSSFLKKISHSSKELRLDNIKGSFNGSDIIKEYQGIINTDNEFENAEKLFAYHCGVSWKDNLERLVEATNAIVAKKNKLVIANETREVIYKSIIRAQDFVASSNFSLLFSDLNERVRTVKNEILIASRIENVNIRGRLIEALITSSSEVRESLLKDLANIEKTLPAYDTKNGLGDYNVSFDNGNTQTDIKTKIVYLHSNPKAYNIDKFLEAMSDNDTIFLLYFVGINEMGVFNTVLCSVYDNQLIEGTVVQEHWAGRNSRGVTQFYGEVLDSILKQETFKTSIDYDKAKDFVNNLIML